MCNQGDGGIDEHYIKHIGSKLLRRWKMSVTHTTRRYMSFVSIVLVFVLILSTEARAAMYDFEVIPDTQGGNPVIGNQLSLVITEVVDQIDIGGVLHNQALFTFNNAGPVPSTIAAVYFQDGELLKIAEIINTLDPDKVVFAEGGSPPVLPGGGSLPFPFTEPTAINWFMAAESKSGNWAGVDPTESLGIKFALQPSRAFEHVIDAIELGFTTQIPGKTLRIGMHVISIGDNEYSQSYILTPVPGAFLLGILGLGVAGLKLRRFA